MAYVKGADLHEVLYVLAQHRVLRLQLQVLLLHLEIVQINYRWYSLKVISDPDLVASFC